MDDDVIKLCLDSTFKQYSLLIEGDVCTEHKKVLFNTMNRIHGLLMEYTETDTDDEFDILQRADRLSVLKKELVG